MLAKADRSDHALAIFIPDPKVGAERPREAAMAFSGSAMTKLPEASRRAVIEQHLAALRSAAHASGVSVASVGKFDVVETGAVLPPGELLDESLGNGGTASSAQSAGGRLRLAVPPPGFDGERAAALERAVLEMLVGRGLAKPTVVTLKVIEGNASRLAGSPAAVQPSLPMSLWGRPDDLAHFEAAQAASEQIGRAGQGAGLDARAASACIDRPERIFRQLTGEGKGEVALHEAWVQEQIAHMKAAAHVTQNPLEYLLAPDHDSHAIVTRFHALSGDTASQAGRIVRQAREAGVPDVMVLGSRGRQLDLPGRSGLFDHARFLVLPQGDFHAVSQFLQALRYLGSGRLADLPPEQRYKSIVIEDFAFYRPLLEGLFGPCEAAAPGVDEEEAARLYYQAALSRLVAAQAGDEAGFCTVHLLEGSQRTIPVCVERNESIVGCEQREGLSAAIGPAPAAIDGEQLRFSTRINVSNLFIGTTKEPKLLDWCGGFANDGVDIRFLMELINDLGDPAEMHHTYIANSRGLPDESNSGKAESFARTIRSVLRGEHRSITRAAFVERLQRFGIDPAKHDDLYFLVDDRGVEFEHWPLLEPYLSPELRAEVQAEVDRRVGGQDTRFQPVPGVETTWWLNKAGGPRNLMEEFVRAYEKYEEATGIRLERKVTSVCVATLVRVDLERDEVAMHDFAGSTTFGLRRPAPGAYADDTEGWYVPDPGVNPDGMSVRELIDETATGKFAPYLPWVKTIEGMRAAGFTFENPRQKQLVPDYAVCVIGAGRDAEGVAWQREITTHAEQTLGPEKCSPASVVSFETGHAATPPSAFDPYEIGRQVLQHDAFVFDRVPAGATGMADMAKLMYEFFSVLVDKNIHPDKKDIKVLVNQDDPRLSILRRIVALQHEHGLSYDPGQLLQTYGTGDDVPALLKTHWADYERAGLSVEGHPSDPANCFSVRDELNAGRSQPRPSVVVLASGKSVAMGVVDETIAVAQKIAGANHDALFGGGTKGLMGEFYLHYLRSVAELQNGGRLAGISTTIVLGKETTSGRLPESLDVAHVTTDIITRMRALFEADVSVFLAGGIGTAEEIGFALAMKLAGDPRVKDQPMVLVNSLMPGGGRLCDGYMEYFGYEDGEPLSGDVEADRLARRERGRQRLEDIGFYVVEAGPDDFPERFDEVFNRACARYGIPVGS
jgi:predicted Rossmann-fold nucleotide-binding protein